MGARVGGLLVGVGVSWALLGAGRRGASCRFLAVGGEGAVRRGPEGQALTQPDMQTDGDWQVIGWVTSGGYAHGVGASMAQGYVPSAWAERAEDGLFEVEILGERRPARIALTPPFDPDGDRMRA